MSKKSNPFSSLRITRKSGHSSPHKPLLVLYNLGRYACGEADKARLIDFKKIKGPLGDLIDKFRFGEFVSKADPWLAFQHLCSDGVWEISYEKGGVAQGGFHDHGRHVLPLLAKLKKVAQGGVPEELHEKLCSDNAFLNESIETVLQENFPPSLHQEILDEIRERIPLRNPLTGAGNDRKA